jgi:hypothetical protein
LEERVDELLGTVAVEHLLDDRLQTRAGEQLFQLAAVEEAIDSHALKTHSGSGGRFRGSGDGLHRDRGSPASDRGESV